MISICLDSGKLAPLPRTAENLKLKKEGSIFSRSYRLQFNAPAADVVLWIQKSEGLRGVVPVVTDTADSRWAAASRNGSGVEQKQSWKHFEFTGSDGEFVVVEINQKQMLVRICVSLC